MPQQALACSSCTRLLHIQLSHFLRAVFAFAVLEWSPQHLVVALAFDSIAIRHPSNATYVASFCPVVVVVLEDVLDIIVHFLAGVAGVVRHFVAVPDSALGDDLVESLLVLVPG